MNSASLKDKLKNISAKKQVDFNSVLRLYMYDRFIERLAVSDYKDKFILKGGFYLSTFFGIENRATMDIDAAIKGTSFSKENVINMISNIIKIDIGDNCLIDIIGVDNIRDDNEYGGYRINLQVRLENIREQFQLDIATGDPVTPKEIIYNYVPILSDKKLQLWSYNMETVMAEKLETILSRAEASSRTRDYYDIYLIYKMYWENINLTHFRKAIENTFKSRGYTGNIEKTVELIKNSEILQTRWESYAKKNKYANDINYSEIMNTIEQIISNLDIVQI